MNKAKVLLLALFFALFLAAPIACAPAALVGNASVDGTGVVGIEEKLGGKVPLDLVFTDESGGRIALGKLVTAPTILALVYYKCPNVCDLLLTGVAGMLRGLDAAPIKDYRVITVSIDETETPADARRAKRIAFETIERPFPPEAWRFLTGDAPSIERLTDSVGFRFRRNGSGFDHPVAILYLSPVGKITHYTYGADFLPADVKLSLLSARAGTVAPTIAQLLRFCFRTDPASHHLVFATLRVAGTSTLLLALVFVAYLLLSSRRRQRTAARKTARKSDPPTLD